MWNQGVADALFSLLLSPVWAGGIVWYLRRQGWRPGARADVASLHAEFQATSRRLRGLLDQLPDPVFLHDAEGHVLDVNQAACDKLGYVRDALLTLTLSTIEVGSDPARLRQLWTSLTPGHPQTLQGELRHRDGSLFSVESHCAVVAAEEGRALLVTVAHDISQRQEQQAAMQRAVEELYQANQRTEAAIDTKNRFLESISYRLRTPLNSILGLTEGILNGALGKTGSSQLDGYLADIHSAGANLQSIIDEVATIATVEAAIASNQQSYQAVIEMSPDAIWLCQDGKISVINSAGVRLLGGIEADQFEGRPFAEVLHPDYLTIQERNFAELTADTTSTPVKLLHLTGRTVDVMLSASASPEGEHAVLIVARNISDLVRANRDMASQAKRLNNILDTVVDGIVVADQHGRIETFNRAAETIFGYSADEVMGRNVSILMTGADAAEHDSHLKRFLETKQPRIIGVGREVTAKRKDGSTFPAEISLSVCNLGDRKLFTAVMRDVTERRAFEEHLSHFATHDTLTGLPNRHMLQSSLQMAVDRVQHEGGHISVWFIDLDGFKMVNDVMGHAAGDELLMEAGQRLISGVKAVDIVTRFGGDEFVLIMHEIRDEAEAASAAERFIAHVSQPFTLRGREVILSLNLGIALYPQHGKSASELVANAGAAMISAKTSGPNHYHFFTPAMHYRSEERLALESALRRGIEREELELHYQPQVDTNSGAIVGLEALVRWNHPELGMVYPSRFIPVAEQTGLILPLGEWVLDRACRDLRALEDMGCHDVSVAVNISPHQFAETDVLSLLRRTVENTRADPTRLDVEITEGSLMNDPDRVAAYLDSMKELGLRLSIDDFGTGYSSLSYLKRFPMDTLKIDRSFVIDIADNHKDEAIAVTIITLAHSMGMTVLAEGVEYDRQGDLLTRLGCDVIQGYLYSKPKPFDIIADYLKSGVKLPVVKL